MSFTPKRLVPASIGKFPPNRTISAISARKNQYGYDSDTYFSSILRICGHVFLPFASISSRSPSGTHSSIDF